MRWEERRESQNVEDRRGTRFGRAGGVGLGTVVLALVAVYFGRIRRSSCRARSPTGSRANRSRIRNGGEAPKREFVATVLADSEDAGPRSSPPPAARQAARLVLFFGAMESACGFAGLRSGRSTVPAIVVTSTFVLRRAAEPFRRARRLRAGVRGRARGRASRADAARHLRAQHGGPQRASERKPDALSVRQELQADCFAGIWAHDADPRGSSSNRRPRGRSRRRRRDRRRPFAEAVARPRLAGSPTHGSSSSACAGSSAASKPASSIVRHVRHEKF